MAETAKLQLATEFWKTNFFWGGGGLSLHKFQVVSGWQVVVLKLDLLVLLRIMLNKNNIASPLPPHRSLSYLSHL